MRLRNKAKIGDVRPWKMAPKDSSAGPQIEQDLEAGELSGRSLSCLSKNKKKKIELGGIFYFYCKS